MVVVSATDGDPNGVHPGVGGAAGVITGVGDAGTVGRAVTSRTGFADEVGVSTGVWLGSSVGLADPDI